MLDEKDKRIENLNREVEGLQKEVERLDMFALENTIAQTAFGM